jgi:hypothetical protein
MTAAAGAARAGQEVVGGGGPTTAALGLVVAGGLVEGVALGTAQSRVLPRWVPRLRGDRFLLATVVVAGLGWAAASAPGVLMEDDGGGAGPSWWLVTAGAAGLGLVMGAVLGAAQASAMPAAARRTWLLANVAAWPPAMVLIFVGASSPGAGWSLPAVLATGALTGLVAGSVLGVVSGWFLPKLATAATRSRESSVPRGR